MLKTVFISIGVISLLLAGVTAVTQIANHSVYGYPLLIGCLAISTVSFFVVTMKVIINGMKP